MDEPKYPRRQMLLDRHAASAPEGLKGNTDDFIGPGVAVLQVFSDPGVRGTHSGAKQPVEPHVELNTKIVRRKRDYGSTARPDDPHELSHCRIARVAREMLEHLDGDCEIE